MRREGERFGRYRLGRLLGRGGMGEVYEAVLLGPFGFEKPVALKIMLEQDDEDLLSEAQLGAWMCHANVLSTYELGTADGACFIAMERVPGGKTAKQAAPMTELQALDVISQACAGLLHIHQLSRHGRPLNLVHRDLKPSNLLLHPDGRVQIADFGITTRTGSATAAVGTLGYAPPEQIDGEASQASDLFALGATLYALVHGVSPFGRGIEALDAGRKAHEHIEHPDALRPFSAPVRELLWRLLQHAPQARGSTEQCLADLRRAKEQSAPVAQTSTAEAAEPTTETPTVPILRSNISPRIVLGRDPERLALRDLLATRQLVSVLGPGGIGKTALASAEALAWAHLSGRPAWFVDLAHTRNEGDVRRAVAEVLGVPSPDQLDAALRARSELLLVLDNAEQVVDEVAGLAHTWAQLGHVKLLVTSQVPLRLDQEATLRLGPLTHEAARELFHSRCGEWPPDNLVQQLDGLPLALELAAGRVQALGLANVAAQISDRFALLNTRSRSKPERHRTLSASIEWSIALLDEPLLALLEQLAVFVGSFTVEDVLHLAEGTRALDLLAELVERSLVHREGDGFRLLLSVREFVMATLPADHEATLFERHGWAMARLRTDRAEWGPATRARLAPRQADLAAACERALQAQNADLAMALCVALDPANPRGRDQWDRYDRCLELPLSPADRSYALVRSSHGAPDLEAHRRLEEAVDLDPSSPTAHATFAWACRRASDPAAAWRHTAVAVRLAKQQGTLPSVVGKAVSVALTQGRMEEARALVATGAASAHPEVRADVLLADGRVAEAAEVLEHDSGLYKWDLHATLGRSSAIRPFLEEQETFRQLGDLLHDAYCCGVLSWLLWHAGREEEARQQRAHLREIDPAVGELIHFFARVQCAVCEGPWGSPEWEAAYSGLLEESERRGYSSFHQRIQLYLAEGCQEAGDLARAKSYLQQEASPTPSATRAHYRDVLLARQRLLEGDASARDERKRLLRTWKSWGGGPLSRNWEALRSM